MDRWRTFIQEYHQFDHIITGSEQMRQIWRQVAQIAASEEAASQTPVIMLTGWGKQSSPTAERTPHVDILLSKPPQLADLRAALETVSSNSRRTGNSPV